MGIRLDHTAVGATSADGALDNNAWVVGDDDHCLVIDAPDDVEAIRELVAGRQVVGVLCTQAREDRVRVAPQLAHALRAPIYLHPADRPLWEFTHPSRKPDSRLVDRQTFHIGRLSLQVMHTPGRTPGSVCFYCPDFGTAFTGDTLLADGPGGRSFFDRDALTASVRTRLLRLPSRTRVRPGRGPVTTIGEVAAQFDEWAQLDELAQFEDLARFDERVVR